jgi:hypothetical protein
MIEDIKEFYNNNSTMVIIAIVALVAMVGFMLFRRMNSNSEQSPFPSQYQKESMDGMDAMGSVCDMASGMCSPPEHMAQMSPEQEQQMAQQQAMMQQQMMMQQEGGQGGQQGGQQEEQE